MQFVSEMRNCMTDLLYGIALLTSHELSDEDMRSSPPPLSRIGCQVRTHPVVGEYPSSSTFELVVAKLKPMRKNYSLRRS